MYKVSSIPLSLPRLLQRAKELSLPPAPRSSIDVIHWISDCSSSCEKVVSGKHSRQLPITLYSPSTGNSTWWHQRHIFWVAIGKPQLYNMRPISALPVTKQKHPRNRVARVLNVQIKDTSERLPSGPSNTSAGSRRGFLSTIKLCELRQLGRPIPSNHQP
jgi:hypothetical protein